MPTLYPTLTNDDLLKLLDDANVFGDDLQYDCIFEELRQRDALPYYLEDEFECGCYDDDADLESYSLECAFGPEE